MRPDVYPMQTTSTRDNIEWSVEPHVRTRIGSDIYLYVAGSSYVDQVNQRVSNRAQGVSDEDPHAGIPDTQTIEFTRNETIDVGPWQITFRDFRPASEDDIPENTMIAVRSLVEVYHRPTDRTYELEPLFAVYSDDGESFIYSPPKEIDRFGLGVRFTRINPDDDSVELTFNGLPEEYEEDWVVIVAEKKPFVSVVWLGTFLLMGGFTISIFRHWAREKEAST
jgi:cytochrome c-type biogenesis protein CcmF